jgi:hypothetical protein
LTFCGIEIIRRIGVVQNIDCPAFALYFSNLSSAEIISKIPNLSHEARREIMRCIIEAEEEAITLADCNRRARERFQMLDAMEADLF